MRHMADRELSELIPDHMTEQEVRQLVDECETVFDFQRETRTSRTRARKIVKMLDAYRELTTAAQMLDQTGAQTPD